MEMKIPKAMSVRGLGLTPLALVAALLLFLALMAGTDTASSQTPPTPEQGDGSGVQDFPPIEGKINPPRYPNMDSNLNRIVQQVESGQSTAQAAAANAPIHREESVAVTLYVTEGYDQDVWDWLEENGGDPRNIGVDYIEAYVPVSLLAEASQQEGIIGIRTIVPPQPAQGALVSEGVAAHGAHLWHAAGFTGQGVKIGIIDAGYDSYHSLAGSELPSNVQVLCFTEIGRSSSDIRDCAYPEEPRVG